MELRPDEIQEILRVFADSPIEELRLEIGGTRLHASKRTGTIPPPTETATVESPRVAEAVAASTAPHPVAESATQPGSMERHPVASSPSDDHLYDLRSPLLGVFYRRPAPGEPPFVEVGSEIVAGDPVCIVDVMKMFTRVEAGVAGRIVEICVEDGQLVEHGQVLVRIAPK